MTTYWFRTLSAGILALSSWTSSWAQGGDAILIGQSAGLSGGQAKYSEDLKSGIEAYFAATNRNGGVAGKTLKLLSVDDKGKKDQVLDNTKKLVENDKVFALIGYTSGAGVEGSLDYLASAKVPMLAPATGNMGIRTKANRYVFHTRAGYDEEMRRVVVDLAGTAIKRIGIAYLGDVGPANPAAMKAALAAHNLTPTVELPLDRNATDFSEPVKKIVEANPQVMLFISNAKPLAIMMRELKAAGWRGRVVTSSFSGTGVIDELKEDAYGLIMTQVLPAYWRTQVNLVKDYQEHLKTYKPDAKPNYTSLEGYVAARVLVEGLRRAGGAGSRERFVEALEGLRKFDLGGYEVSFSEKNRDGSRYVDTGIVSSGGQIRF
jgi:branched-chain amino acid transport system substrate-binding protein